MKHFVDGIDQHVKVTMVVNRKKPKQPIRKGEQRVGVETRFARGRRSQSDQGRHFHTNSASPHFSTSIIHQSRFKI
jgi:hypothetical protein